MGRNICRRCYLVLLVVIVLIVAMTTTMTKTHTKTNTKKKTKPERELLRQLLEIDLGFSCPVRNICRRCYLLLVIVVVMATTMTRTQTKTNTKTKTEENHQKPTDKAKIKHTPPSAWSQSLRAIIIHKIMHMKNTKRASFFYRSRSVKFICMRNNFDKWTDSSLKQGCY